MSHGKLTDNEFIDFDNDLYMAIQHIMGFDYEINSDEPLFDVYCQLRDMLIDRIELHNRGVEI